MLDNLTLPQVLFCVLQKAEYEHGERVWEMQTMALAVAAGMGSQSAYNAIKGIAKRKLEQRQLTFGELLAREQEKQQTGG